MKRFVHPASAPEAGHIRDLGQFMTPEWAARELLGHYFGDLSTSDQVIEPSCGEGAFLRSIPKEVPAIGVELDPVLAEMARESSGRKVIVGDFAAVELPTTCTAVVGNPPFQSAVVHRFLDRAWDLLPDDGRAGLILPVYTFQTSSTVARLAERWSIRQDLLPRNLFPGLSLPLCFAMLRKSSRGPGRLFNFALYYETSQVAKLQARYRALLAQGQRGVWNAVSLAALESLGGEADLCDIYKEVHGARPTGTEFWREKVRQCLQRVAVRTGPGRYALPLRAAA